MSSPTGDKRESASNCDACGNGGPEDDLSVVEYFGSDSGFCGYCKRSQKETGTGKRSHNLNTYRLRVEDYQDMIDTNWRRSGNFCYNPINQKTCCPNYPIICKTRDFILSRSQRNCIKTVNSYIINGDSKSTKTLDYASATDWSYESEGSTATKSFDEIKTSSKAKARRFVKSCEKKVRLNNISLEEAIRQVREKWQGRYRKQNLMLEDYLYPKVGIMSELEREHFRPQHKLTIEMHHVNSKRSRDLRESEHSIMVKYQQKIHKETSKEWDMSRYCDFLVTTPLVTEPLTNFDYLQSEDRSSADQDKLVVDVEANEASSYLLVKPPPLPTSYGTYHCCYLLDDELIAVGVLDILPRCITTVYFFYNPKYGFLNLGIYSALVEISMVRLMDRHVSDKSIDNPLTDYYLGFYVHECKKMRYKTRFKPSYMLCSKTHKYVPTEICLELLKDRKYADFCDEEEATKDSDDEFDLKKLLRIPIVSPVDLVDQKLRTYLGWLQASLGTRYVDLIVNGWLIPYARIVGDKLLPRLCLRMEGIHQHLLKRHERLNGGQSSSGRARIG